MKKPLQTISYGLFVLTTAVNGNDYGCIVNTVSQVANPQRIAVSVNKANYTHDMILKSGVLTVSVLNTEVPFSVFERFGFHSGRDTDKFSGYPFVKEAPNHTLYITEGVCSYLCAKVVDTVDLGSHTMFIADVTASETLNDVPSLTYDYYHANVKPKRDASAPKQGKMVWRCKICGYIYEGDELPEDFICPLCKHPASDFERVEI